MELDGSQSYTIRRSSLLAMTEGIYLRSRFNFRGSFSLIPRLEVQGVGSLALYAKDASIFRMKLNASEEYSVHGRYMTTKNCKQNNPDRQLSISLEC